MAVFLLVCIVCILLAVFFPVLWAVIWTVPFFLLWFGLPYMIWGTMGLVGATAMLALAVAAALGDRKINQLREQPPAKTPVKDTKPTSSIIILP